MTMVALRVDEDEWRRARARAALEGTTVSAVVRAAVGAYADGVEGLPVAAAVPAAEPAVKTPASVKSACPKCGSVGKMRIDGHRWCDEHGRF